MQKHFCFSLAGVRCESARHAGGRIKCPSDLCGEKQTQAARVRYIILHNLSIMLLPTLETCLEKSKVNFFFFIRVGVY